MKKLKIFAEAVGLKVRKVKVADLVDDTFIEVLDSRGERICLETDVEAAAEAIEVYAGGHPNFADALREYRA